MSRPAVVLTGKFARPKSSVFVSYIEYMDREEAVRNEAYNEYSAFVKSDNQSGAIYEGETENLDEYLEYLSNPYKTSRLFTHEKNKLTEEEKQKMKDLFTLGYENESVMWQDVFSFDNEWLIENKFYNPKSKLLDEEKIMSATRAGMRKMLETEGLIGSAVWTGSIHYNTDNIHIHTATVEPVPQREKKRLVDKETGEITDEVRGTRSRKTLRLMKSAFANELMEFGKQYQRIDEIQKQVIEAKRNTSFKDEEKVNQTLAEQFLALRKQLPAQKGYWKYGFAKRLKFDQPLNTMIQNFLQTNFPKEMNELQMIFDTVEQEQLRMYGDSKGQGDWQKGKWKTLYTRLGNDILNEMKEEKHLSPLSGVRVEFPEKRVGNFQAEEASEPNGKEERKQQDHEKALEKLRLHGKQHKSMSYEEWEERLKAKHEMKQKPPSRDNPENEKEERKQQDREEALEKLRLHGEQHKPMSYEEWEERFLRACDPTELPDTRPMKDYKQVKNQFPQEIQEQLKTIKTTQTFGKQPKNKTVQRVERLSKKGREKIRKGRPREPYVSPTYKVSLARKLNQVLSKTTQKYLNEQTYRQMEATQNYLNQTR